MTVSRVCHCPFGQSKGLEGSGTAGISRVGLSWAIVVKKFIFTLIVAHFGKHSNFLFVVLLSR